MGAARLLRLLDIITVFQQVRCLSISVPHKVTAVEGSCVVVPCLTQPHAQVIWHQYHNIRYPVVYDGLQPQKVEAQFRGRTSLLGKASEGNCSLMIDNLSSADNNLQVYVSVNPGSTRTKHFFDQTVTISVERKSPIMSVQKQIVEGEIVEATCSIWNTCPFSSPSFFWTKSHFFEDFTLLNFNKETHGHWQYKQTLRGRATHKVHNTKIRCSAKFGALVTDSQEKVLIILYKPVSVMMRMLEKDAVMEGGSVTVECSANSNPQPHTYLWIRRQKGINNNTNSTQRTMSFHHLTRETSLSCAAQNNIGEGHSDWMDLPVHYAPVILPESTCSMMGDLIRCLCHADAFPKPLITWNIDGNHRLLFLHPTISIFNNTIVSVEVQMPVINQTNVSCIAWNQYGTDAKQLYLSLPKPPSSSLLMWLLCSMAAGIILLFGCVMCLKIKYSRNRSSFGNIQLEAGPRRLQAHHSNQQRPEAILEENSNSYIYDNDELEDVRSELHYQNNSTLHCRDWGTFQLKNVNSSMETFLNCRSQNTHC